MLSEDPASFLDLAFGTGSAVLDVGFAGRSSFVVEGSEGASLATMLMLFVVCDDTTGTTGLITLAGVFEGFVLFWGLGGATAGTEGAANGGKS